MDEIKKAKLGFFGVAIAGLIFVVMAGTAISKALDFPFPLASLCGGAFVGFVMQQLWVAFKRRRNFIPR